MSQAGRWIAEFPGNFVWSKHLKIFTAADGGTSHAQADNRQVGMDYIADWIAEALR